MDTYSSVVSANLHLENGVTGSVFVSKKADRDVASIGSNPDRRHDASRSSGCRPSTTSSSSRATTTTPSTDAQFELIDQGYAMCLVDDGTGTGTKVAKYYVDADGNYYELYTYVLYSPHGGVLETSTFTLRVTLGAPGEPEHARRRRPRRRTTSTRRIWSRRSTRSRT